MNIKLRLFKHTFVTLSMMCCLLLCSTSIIFAISELNSNIFETNGIKDAESSESTKKSGDNDTTQHNKLKSDSSGENNITSIPPSNDKAPSKNITITAVGDLMSHQGNLNNAYNPKTGTYDFNGCFEYVKPYLLNSDLCIGNLETVMAGSKYGYTSYPLFNTPDAMLNALSNTGFDVLSTANNHCLDRGLQGLTRTINKIQQNNMTNVGSSLDGKNKYITKEVNGIKVSILSYTYAFNGNEAKLSSIEKSRHLSPINESIIKKDIETVKKQNTDAIIVIMHWGNEYQRQPNSTQTALAKKILVWGADVILGSHTHVIQKSEIVKLNNKNKFIIYSMGNFISGYRRFDSGERANKLYTEDGVIVQLQLEKDPKGGVILKKADYIPTWVDKYYVNNRPVYKIIPIDGIDNLNKPYINEKNIYSIKQSYKHTIGVMDKLK